jgi:hypothetical protein
MMMTSQGFADIEPTKPVRKDAEGRIYFNLRERLRPGEYYKNEDIFVNWEKFVRNESGLGGFYKTLLNTEKENSGLVTLVLFHLHCNTEEDNQLIIPAVDRSVEVCLFL